MARDDKAHREGLERAAALREKQQADARQRKIDNDLRIDRERVAREQAAVQKRQDDDARRQREQEARDATAEADRQKRARDQQRRNDKGK